MDSNPNTVNATGAPCSATKVDAASEIEGATRKRERYSAVTEPTIMITRIAAATILREFLKLKIRYSYELVNI